MGNIGYEYNGISCRTNFDYNGIVWNGCSKAEEKQELNPCLGCNRDPKVLKPSERCPICDVYLGNRDDFPSYAEFQRWNDKEVMVIQ